MFTYVESIREISKAQSKLENSLKRDFSKVVKKNIGYPGGTENGAKVQTDGRYWFRAADYKIHNPRRLNWFGRFSENPGTSISAEINVAYEGRNNLAAGFFGRDSDTGMVYLFHSGRVGGGKKGVGKDAFCTWFNEPLVDVFDSTGASRQGLIVMPVDGVGASRSAVRYIAEVDKFKLAVRANEIDTPAFREKQRKFKEFYSEGRGGRKGRRSSKIDYLSRHGEIVDALHLWRKKTSMPKGGKIVKDTYIDMGVVVGKELAEVFEVKTSADRQLFYTALGQLLVHGVAENCRRVMVLPNSDVVPYDLCEALTRLGVELVRFNLSETDVVILKESSKV